MGSPGADNWRTATFEASAPLLAPELQPHAPFEPDDPISVSVEHRFGTAHDQITLRTRTEGELKFGSNTPRQLSVSWWPGLDEEDAITVQGGSINTKIDPLGFTKFAEQLIGQKVPNLPELLKTMSIRDALALTVLNLRDRSDLTEKTTKTAATRSAQNSASLNGMELNLSIFTRETAGSVHSIARAAPQLGFCGEAYGGPYRGLVHKGIDITYNNSKIPTDARGISRITLFDDPFPRDQTNAILGTDLTSQRVPEKLQHLL